MSTGTLMTAALEVTAQTITGFATFFVSVVPGPDDFRLVRVELPPQADKRIAVLSKVETKNPSGILKSVFTIEPSIPETTRRTANNERHSFSMQAREKRSHLQSWREDLGKRFKKVGKCVT